MSRPFSGATPSCSGARCATRSGRRSPADGIAIAEALLALGRGEPARARELLDDLIAREPALSDALAADPDLGPLLAR